jgi:cytochrome c556
MKRLNGLPGRLAVITLACVAGAAQADDQDVIDYRRHIMKTMGEQVAVLGMILEKRAPASDLATHAQVLAITAATARMAFEQEIQGGDAKPEVWTKWADFSKRMDALVTATGDIAKSAKAGGVTPVAPKLQALNCKSCHDTYRKPR